MTTLIIQTEDANRRRWTVVDIIENLYLHLVRFLYGAWTSPFVWLIFGIIMTIQHPQTWWGMYVRDILVIAFVANFGRLWEWHNATRKAYVKNIVAGKNQVVTS
jgi:hypothetical protein